MSVEAFEDWVVHQPAAVQWEPVTDYSPEARRIAEGKHPQLIKDVFQPASVLDYGCGQGRLVELLEELGVLVEGYDPHFRPNLAALHRQHELVVCREVLEHVAIRDWSLTARALVSLTSRYLYLTTRFAKAPKDYLDFDTQDALDPTHTTLLHKDFVRAFFVMHGLKSRYDLEKQMDWQHKGRCLVFEKV